MSLEPDPVGGTGRVLHGRDEILSALRPGAPGRGVNGDRTGQGTGEAVGSGEREDRQPEVAEAGGTAGEPPIVVAEQVTLGYGRTTVLRDVTLEIRAGEFWAFLGPNGEGKTTLIKALLGAIQPQRGRIALRPDFQKRTRLAFVPQETELNPSLPTTVEEFVSGGFVGLRLDRARRRARLRQSLELMGIPLLRERSLWTLSGGQRQRALIARALVRDPLLLVVDEPTAGLDLAAASSLLRTLTGLNREKGITIVFVTHDLSIAARHATHAALFRRGQCQCGPQASVLTEAHLSRTFGVPVAVRRDAVGELHLVAAGVA
ncbi:MAG: ABC transporter ATP-binding protein [Verrucomicrobiae bacterium]|nr:ABC transporter ATP-binding protein [Verrucomicrobiae bacterium]